MLSAMDDSGDPKCPICGTYGAHMPSEGYDGEVFMCPTHLRMRLARGARRYLERMNQHGRDAHFEIASAANPDLPEFTSRGALSAKRT